MIKRAYIKDNLGQKWELVQFFDNESQEYLCALRFVPEPTDASTT